ncbi:jg8200 [Pararge aegeria aegeria]|uniref:Jg8200 protein n=1 Tax=Pararge aegeria aegeria TaxID=348720 RepID=A0A8S4SLN3_9NEOP|nr:jg8200 [Pararge aegeria aegeria]
MVFQGLTALTLYRGGVGPVGGGQRKGCRPREGGGGNSDAPRSRRIFTTSQNRASSTYSYNKADAHGRIEICKRIARKEATRKYPEILDQVKKALDCPIYRAYHTAENTKRWINSSFLSY